MNRWFKYIENNFSKKKQTLPIREKNYENEEENLKPFLVE